MYWITPEGVEYLTDIIEGFKYKSREGSRELDILGSLESRGGGYTKSQIISLLAGRDIENPLIGSRESYSKTFDNLESRGLVVNTRR